MISAASVENFYRCAVASLEALERREGRGRRFGANAEALWRSFAGNMDDAARLDYLCRDAAVIHPVAFSPRLIFGLHALSVDEAFGPEWPGIDSVRAAQWMHERSQTAQQPRAVLESVAKRWGLSSGQLTDQRGNATSQLDSRAITPATRLIVCGAAAAPVLFDAFAERGELDIIDQCTFVADAPGERQLFGTLLALASRPGATRATPRILRTEDVNASTLRAAGFARCDLYLADASCAKTTQDAALGLAKELGLA